MKKIVFALVGLSALGALSTAANALPAAPLSGVSSGAEQVRYVCDAWGRCWWRPNRYYAPRYYGPRYYAPRPYYGPRFYGGYGGWRHRW